MAKAMKKDGVYLFISKPYSVVEWTKFTEENRDIMDRIVLCRSELESQGLFFLLDNVPEIRRVYVTSNSTVLSENFKKFVQRVKTKYPSYAVMVGQAEETPPRVLLEANPEAPNVAMFPPIAPAFNAVLPGLAAAVAAVLLSLPSLPTFFSIIGYIPP